MDLHSFWLAFNSVFHHALVLVLALGIGIGIGQYYWVLGAFFGIVLTLPLHSKLIQFYTPCYIHDVIFIQPPWSTWSSSLSPFIILHPSHALKSQTALFGMQHLSFRINFPIVRVFISNRSRPGNDQALENHSFLVPGQKFCVLFRAWCRPGQPDFYPVKNCGLLLVWRVVQSAALFTSCYPAKPGALSDI